MTATNQELLLHTGADRHAFDQRIREGRWPFSHQVRLPWPGPRDILVCRQEGSRFTADGVLRDVTKHGSDFHFRRYDRFARAVVLQDSSGNRSVWPDDQGFGGSYQRIPAPVFAAIMREANSSRDPKAEARTFAAKAARRFRGDWGPLVRDAYDEGEHPRIDDRLKELTSSSIVLTTEGGREGANHRNYELLGTGAFPDAAVIRPFRCAIEYDRQTSPNQSAHLKTSLLKTAAHVLCGAYDAAVHVFIFHDNHKYPPEEYGLDATSTAATSHNLTRTFLMQLEEHGVFLAAWFPGAGR